MKHLLTGCLFFLLIGSTGCGDPTEPYSENIDFAGSWFCHDTVNDFYLVFNVYDGDVLFSGIKTTYLSSSILWGIVIDNNNINKRYVIQWLDAVSTESAFVPPAYQKIEWIGDCSADSVTLRFYEGAADVNTATEMDAGSSWDRVYIRKIHR